MIIHNSFPDGTPSHTGDAILSRPIIITIKETFKDLISLQFEKKHHYFFDDLGLPLTERTISGPNFNAWFGCYADIMTVHGMSYFTQIHSFNRQMEAQNLPYRLNQPEKMPMLHFPPPNEPINTVPNCILIENGQSLSGQNFIDMNPLLPRLVNDFKKYFFYTSAPTSFTAPNLCNIPFQKGLVILHHVSNKCIALITRGSGVNAATYSEINRNKPRAIVGWNYPYKLWDHNFTACATYEQLCVFVNNLKMR